MNIKYLPLLFMLFSASCSNFGGGKSGSAEGNGWPIFRGNPGLSAYSKQKLPDNPQLLWAYKSNSRTSSSPVVYNQTAYWCNKRGKILGVDSNGELTFDYDFATAVEASPMVSDSTLFIGRIDGFLSAVSLSKKDTVWNFETLGQISASPNSSIFEGTEAIVFGSYDNYLYCINKKEGKLINRFESGYYINGAAAVMGNFFISGGCDAWLRIIDGQAGIVSDSLKLDTYIPASPAIDGKDCYIADHSGNVYALVIEKGKISSSKKMVAATDSNGSCLSTPALSSSTLYILSTDRYLYAIDRETGKIRWKYLQKGNSGESSPVVCGDKVISCTRSGIISLLDADKGELLWEYDAGEQITSSPAAANGKFYILTTSGTLFCFGEKK